MATYTMAVGSLQQVNTVTWSNWSTGSRVHPITNCGLITLKQRHPVPWSKKDLVVEKRQQRNVLSV
jgi:hypothetical protein